MKLTVPVLFLSLLLIAPALSIMVQSDLTLPTIKSNWKDKGRKAKSSSELSSANMKLQTKGIGSISPPISSLYKFGTSKTPSTNEVPSVALQSSSRRTRSGIQKEELLLQSSESTELTLPNICASNNSITAASHHTHHQCEISAKFVLHGTGFKNNTTNGTGNQAESKAATENRANIINQSDTTSTVVGQDNLCNKQNESGNFMINPSQLHLKFPANIHKIQTGSEFCSIINLRMPLPCTNSWRLQANTGSISPAVAASSAAAAAQDFIPSETQVGILQKCSSKSDDHDIKMRCDAWENRSRDIKKKKQLDHSADHLTSALIQLRKVASSLPSSLTKEYNNSIAGKESIQASSPLNIINFEKQAAALPECRFNTPRTNPKTSSRKGNLVSTNYSQAESSQSSSTDSSLCEIQQHASMVCHRVSLLTSSLEEKKIKHGGSNVKSLLLPAKHLLSPEERGHNFIMHDRSMYTKQLLKLPISNHLFKRTSFAGGSGGQQDTPLHHSFQTDLSIEGSTNKKHVYRKSDKTKPFRSMRASLIKETHLPPLEKASLRITSVKLHECQPARLSVASTSVVSPRKNFIKQAQSNISLSNGSPDKGGEDLEYSYLDPLLGASSHFQWKLNKLHDREYNTKRKETRLIKK